MAKVLGIVNVTPDSFWEGSRMTDRKALVERVGSMISCGAHAVDIGGFSTRPGFEAVPETEELERLDRGLDAIRTDFPDFPVSVDTFRPSVAHHCIERWNVQIVNDVSGGSAGMFELLREKDVKYVLTCSMPVENDVIQEMESFFSSRLEELSDMRDRVILDPGFGFGKTLDDNYRVLASLGRLKRFGCEVLAGMSRKSMAYRLLGTTAEDSLNATTVLDTVALAAGADWIRVHDVKEAVQAVRIMEKLNENRI